MVAIAVQATIPYKTGVPTDISVNTWSFEVGDDTDPQMGEAVAFLAAFYGSIAPRMSPILAMDMIRMKVYVRSDVAPAPPRIDTIIDAGLANTGAQLPEEVSCCLSFRAVLAPGSNPARRRGRIFLGPLATTAAGTSGLRSVPADAFISDIGTAYDDGLAELTTAGNVHTVWSPTNATNLPVVTATVDNAWDTQRSRGTEPSLVTTVFP